MVNEVFDLEWRSFGNVFFFLLICHGVLHEKIPSATSWVGAYPFAVYDYLAAMNTHDCTFRLQVGKSLCTSL